MSEIIKACGLTEAGLQTYIKVCAKQYRKSVSSQQVQKEATRVYAGVEKVLYRDGKTLHFKKCRDITTISGKTNTNGVKFNKETMSIDWLGLHIECKIPHRNSKRDKAKLDYITKALNSDISYCEIKRAILLYCLEEPLLRVPLSGYLDVAIVHDQQWLFIATQYSVMTHAKGVSQSSILRNQIPRTHKARE